jgi:hypothetical protein
MMSKEWENKAIVVRWPHRTGLHRFFVGFLPANSRRKMQLRVGTVLRITNRTIAEEMTRLTWATKLPKSCCLGNHEVGRSQPRLLSKVRTQ